MQALFRICAVLKMSADIRVADLVVDKLISAGIDHFFILVGGNVMYLNDAILKSGIPYTAFHHEQSATMAAEAYARLHNKISCVVVTSGPGASNVTTGVAGAFYDSAPVLVICGNPKSTDLRMIEMPLGVRQVGTFELPIHEVCKSISKFSELITSVSEVEQVVSDAIEHCVYGRPGPSVINFPLDIQGALISPDVTESSNADLSLDSKLPEKTLEFLSDLVLAFKNSTCPAVLIGHGVRVSGMAEIVLQKLKELNLPVFTTQLAKDFIPYSDELFIGHVGVRGDRPGNVGIHRADLILCIGTSLHQQNIGYEPHLFAPSAEKFIVEFEGSVSGKNLPIKANYLDMGIEMFTREFGNQIVGYKNSNSAWLSSLLELKYKYPVSSEMHDYSTTRVNMYEFVEKLSIILEGGETVITDAGLCFYVMGQAFKLKHDQRYIVSGGLGSMGYALPAAIGASINQIGPVIAVTGDGSMQMNVQELGTLKSLGSNTKIFVISNFGYASLRNTQKSFFKDGFIGSSDSSGLSMPDWRLISDSYGVDYVSIGNSLELAECLPSILANKSTQLIEVLCQRDQVVMPGIGNYKDEFGKLRSRPLSEMIPSITEDVMNSNLIIN